MNKFFEINPGRKENNDSPSTFSLGIKMKIGNLETICTVTEDLSYDELESEINSLKDELDSIKKKLESFNKGEMSHGGFGVDDDASPQEVWGVLSTVTDNSLMIEHFNSLSEFKRRELADHIFANCNMFTGKGAYFSAHYVPETALLTA